MDYKKDFCEHIDCPEHPNHYEYKDGLISHANEGDHLLGTTIEDVIRNATHVVIQINGVIIPFACSVCSNHKDIDMKSLMKKEMAKKELKK